MEKIRNFVYLNTKAYMSLTSLKYLYWGIIFIPIIMIVMGIAAKNLFPIVSILIWTLLYWAFVLVIQSKRVKKTFELRFLVNGISGLFVSSLIWLFVTAFNVAADIPPFGLEFCLWILLFYFVFTAVYIAIALLLVHKGVYGKMREKNQGKTVNIAVIILAALFPSTITARRTRAKLMREYLSVSTQTTIIMVFVALFMILCALINLNFVRYYYCKKYGITCNEYGDSTSPKLERKPKKSEIRKKKTEALQVYENVGSERSLKMSPDAASESWAPEMTAAGEKILVKKKKRKIPVLVKIIIGIALAIAAFFVILFIIGFIKAIIENI